MKKNLSFSVYLSIFLCVPAWAQPWAIRGNTLLSETELNAFVTDEDPAQAGQQVVTAYRNKGYLSVQVKVDPAQRLISVIETVAAPSGTYAGYFRAGEVLTTESVELAAARINAAARLNGEKVLIQIKPGSEGTVEVNAAGTPIPDVKIYGGSVIFSSYGQRYSGPDVLTLYGWRNIGNAQQIDASFGHAFSNWRNDSRGGRFDNGTVGYRAATEYGLFNAQIMYADYVSGGRLKEVGSQGDIGRINIEQSYLFTKNFTGSARISYINNSQELTLFKWSDREKYTSLAMIGRYLNKIDNFDYSGEIVLESGLGGSRDYNVIPLMGQFDPHFFIAAAYFGSNYHFNPDWTLSTKLGMQEGQDDTPSAAQFFLGGPDRGRAYSTGYTAMPSGHYISLVLNMPDIKQVHPYIGFDYARGRPAVGNYRTAQSAFLGAAYQFQKQLMMDLSYATVISNKDDPVLSSEHRINLSASYAF